MIKYLKVMHGNISDADKSLKYKIGEVNICNNWNPDAETSEEFGGFNYSSEDKILRWIHRGDTIYDVTIPEDAEIILVNEEKGIYRTNKIIINSPQKLTDELILDLYKKNTLSNKIIAQCLVILLWKDKKEISKYIIKDRVTKENIDEIIEEFVNYAPKDTMKTKDGKEIYKILKELKNAN